MKATDANGCAGTLAYTVTPVCPAITIAQSSLSQGTVGTAYSQTLTASGGTAPYGMWTITGGTLPTGLTLNASTGVISGTPSASASPATTLTVRVNDVNGCQGSRSITLQICPIITLAPATPATGTVGTAYSQTITASGGASSYSFALVSGTLPPGLTLNTSTGVVSGTPSVQVSSNVTLRATDANGCQGTLATTFAISCPVITLAPTTLAQATVGSAYSQTVTASGGSSSYVYAITSGTLPAGLTFNTSTGVISGTPTTSNSGGTSITVSATDSFNCAGTKTYTLQVCPVVTLSLATLSTPTVGTAYTQTLTSAGGAASYTYTLASGSLPAWASLSSSGVISGTPNTTTTATFTVKATDANGCAGTLSYTLTPVCPTVTMAPTALAQGTMGTAYSQTLTASGGVAPYSSWTITSGALPTGLTLNASTGVISGTPTASASQAASFTVRVSDTNGCQGTQAITLQICPVVTLSPATFTAATVGTAYSQTVTAAGGTSSYTYSVSSGSLPSWATLTSAGVLSGTPNSASTSTFTVKATDANGCAGTLAYTLTPVCPTITIAQSALPQGTVGTAYSQTLTASGGTSPYSSWTITSGALPTGLSLNSSTGVISGTPSASASPATTITVRVNDTYGCQGTKSITLQICPVVTLSPATLATPTVGTAYTQTISAAGGASSYTYTVSSGSLPAWATLSSAGVLSGTPTSTTAATFTVKATDANGCAGTQSYTVTPVCPTITIAQSSLPQGTVGTAYSQTLTASGGNAPYSSWTITSGTIPTGLTLNASTGVISGTPTASASPATTLTVRVNDTYGCQGTRAITLQVCPVITISPNVLTAPTIGFLYSQTLTTSGTSSTPLTWSATGLPAWLSMSSSTGVLSGTPTNNTAATFTLTATDAYGCAGSRSYTITPVCPTITLGGTTPPNGYLNTSYFSSITASGGTAPYSFALVTGSMPPGLSMASNGSVSGTPTTLGSYTVTVNATDAYTCQSTTTSVTFNIKGMGIGNQVWVDMNNDGLHGSTESGVPNLAMQLWSPGINGVMDNGGGDDVLIATTTTDSNGLYLFSGLVPGVYYVRIPTPPLFYPQVSTSQVALDNGVNDDNNGLQSASGNPVVTGLITLSPGTEPGVAVDGDDTDTNSTIDFGFANADACQITNLIDNPSFEFQGLPDLTGTATTVLSYDGTGTAFGSGIDAFQWLGGTNGASGVGEPIQRAQVNVSTTGSMVSWVESMKSRHGKRMMMLQGTNSAVNLLPAGGGSWSSVLQAGKEYELSVWAADASSGAASILWNLGANAQIVQIISGAAPGLYQYYSVPQSEMNATAAGVSQCCGYSGGTISYPGFGASDYNNWTEATANTTQPLWRQFTYHFRVANAATSSQIDNLSIALSGGSSTNPVMADLVYLCQVTTTPTLSIGNLVWNDANDNGVRDVGANTEVGMSNVVVDLYTSTNNIAGDADDLWIANTTTNSAGSYNFGGLANGKYVVRVTPPSSVPSTGGNVITVDDGVNNENKGSQPGGPGTYIYSPVITMAAGTEPVNDGDTNPDTNLTIDFGLFSGIQLGNQLFIDANNDGVFNSASESGVGSGVTVQLLDGVANTVITSTTTNNAGVYGFTIYKPATYRVRIPTPPAAYPLVSSVVDTNDDGVDNENHGIQSGGVNSAVISPVITLTAGSEPGGTGHTNTENTIDFGFRACPVISISPGTVAVATQYVAYTPLTLTSTGGSGGYLYAISSGVLPSGISLSSSGVISGTTGASAAPGSYNFTVSSTDSLGCSATQSYTLTLANAIVTVTPTTLPAATQYAAYTQSLVASGGTSPYTWSVGPSALSGAAAWWPGENGGTEVIASNNAAIVGGVTFTPGLVGNAFNFDGSSGYLQVADQSVMRPAQISLEAWVRPASASPAADQIIIEKTSNAAAPADGYGLIQRSGTSTVRFWINGTSSVAGTSEFVDAPVTVSTWNHVVATYDLTNLHIYVNGVQVATKAFTTAINHSTQPLVMGGSATAGTYWSGALDEAVLYSRALSAAEALARYTVTNSGNNGMPSGVTLNASTGVLSGTPTGVPTSYPFTVRATDSYSGVGLRSYSLAVGCPTLNITPKTLADATQYAAYTTVNLSATGGTAPYTWDISTGALPTGLSLSSAGAITGTPSAAPGTYSFTVRAHDANSCVSTQSLTLRVDCPTITLTPNTLSNAQQFAAYSPVQLGASGGSSPYAFSIQSGALPSGMSLSSSGLISGTPSAVPGNYTAVIRATDSDSCTGTSSYTLSVTCPVISLSPSTLNAGRQYQSYNQTLTASGGNTSYTWALATGSTLPTGLSLSSTGIISGTPTVAPGTYTFSVKATDSVGCTATNSCSIVFSCPIISITPTTLPQATDTVAYSQQLAVSGGTSPYTWSLASGVLPTGITLSSAGLISGTTSLVGSFNFTAQASDLNGCVQQQALSLGVTCVAITITPSTLSTATVGTAYSQQFTATGGVGTKTWSIKSGTLPAGMTLSSSGLLSGTPTDTAGTFNFTVQAMDQDSCPGTAAYSLTLQCPAVTITQTTVPNGTVGSSYSTTLTASGSTAPYTWSLPTGSTLPPGLTLNSAGVISGTPTSTGTYSFSVTARSAYSCSGTTTLSITVVCPALVLNPASLSSGYNGVGYSQTITSTGGSGPYTYSVTAGSLPPGVTLNASSGVLSGTPTAAGSYSFTVSSHDSSTCTGSINYSVLIKGLGLGNLVWQDANQNGLFDTGEQGISGVTLQLFSTTDTIIGNADDLSQGTTTTDGTGTYGFSGLAPGNYYVTMPTPPTAYPLSSGPQVVLDNGVDNDNNGIQSGGVGAAIFSPVIALAIGTEPGNVVGGLDVDNTIDFALRAVPASITNLLEYTLNTSSGGLPAPPSLKSAAVVNAAKIQIEDDMNGLTDISEPTNNGPIRSGALSRQMRSWDATYDTRYDSPPTTLVQRPNSLWIRFDMDPTATGNIGNILFDVYRVGSTAPVQGKVMLSWQDGSVIRTAVTSTFSLAATGSWYSMNLGWNSFLGGASALPTGAQLAGKSFMIEIYLWGGDGTGFTDVDNILLQGAATTNPQTLAIGDFVWADTNGNGMVDPREPGLQNILMKLFNPGPDNLPNTSDDQLLSTTTTDANGYYLFSGLAAGNYFVEIPTPNAQWPLASPGVYLDNGVDNESKGIQPGGTGTLVYSPVVTLALGMEPGNTSSGGGNQDMTVDFGFLASMGMGNQVFSDANNNGWFDAGETGVAGAQLEIFRSTDTIVNNGDDVKVGTTFTTAADGIYGFSGLSAGMYYIKLTPPITNPRASSVSTNADNGVDNDNNGVTQAASGAPIYSPMITLSPLTEPGHTLLVPFGGNVDNTIDFGLVPSFCSIGNLVYKDANNNGIYDAGEGEGGVRVDLLNSAGSLVTFTTTSSSSSNRGVYQFLNVVPGSYYVRVPASEFATGKSLANTISIFPATSSDNDVDDEIVGNDDGNDNATPAVNGIISSLITLLDSAEPTNNNGEGGAFNTIDDFNDANGNMTIDFGFKSSPVISTGCYHFLAMDSNADGVLSGATEWTPAQAYDFNYTQGGVANISSANLIYDASLSRLALDMTFNELGASKVDALWFLVSTGSNPASTDHAIVYIDGITRSSPNVTIYKYDPNLDYNSWQTATNLMVSTAAGSSTSGDVLQQIVTETGSNVRFQCVINVSRVNNAANWSSMGVNSATWEGIQAGGTTAIDLHMVHLSSAPTYSSNGALTSFNYTPGVTEASFVTDPSGVFTIATEPCSVSPWVNVGNLVWNDVNNNGLRDTGELGVSGATVQLFTPGADNAIGGTGVNADTQVGSSVQSSSAGAYSFINLVPGKYYLRVTPTSTVPAASAVVATTDNGVDNYNKGIQPGGPGTFIYSPIIDLEVGAEPPTAVDGDGTNGNLTMDFGLFTGITVGDLVWNDANNNGLKDTSELGLSGVQLDLWSPGADRAVGGTGANADTLLQSTTTLSNGSYSFKVYSGGYYFVRVTPPAAYQLASGAVVATNNGNHGTQPGGAGTSIYSSVMLLAAATEPGGTGTTNTENTIDFGVYSCPVITISPASLATALKGQSYSATFTAAGGISPYTWSVTSGTLPSGLTLSSAGVLSGTPTASVGTYSFTVKAFDALQCSATQSITLGVVCPVLTLTPTTLSSAAQNTVFSQQFSSSGGASPYAYSLTSGSLPVGVSLSTGGLLSGTITGAPGNYAFVIRSTDANGCTLDTSLTWTITCPSISLAPATVPAATQYAAYSAQTLTASNGTTPYSWSYTGALPTGMSLSSSGVLSGTPTSAPGSYNITVTATDANGCTRSGAYTITVNCPSITITAPTFPSALKHVAYPSQQLSATGGTSPYSFSIISGALPAGLSMSSTGLISGTPTASPATYNFTVQATDGVNCSATKALQIVISCPTLSIGPVPLPAGVQYAAYSQTMAVGGGTAPYTWSLYSGILPTGITLSSSGVLSGTPTSLGSFTFVVKATDADNCSGTQQLTLTVNYPPITITPATLTNAVRLVPYMQQLSASGGTSPYTFSKLTGSLPTGLSISSGGLISGISTAAPGSYSFTVQALDADGAPGTQPYSITILCPTLVVSPTSLSSGVVGTSYTASLTVAGGSAPYAWSVATGSLPAGLSMNSSGLISGTPTQATNATFTVQAMDSYNCAVTQVYTLVVNCPSVSLTPTTLPYAYYNLPYSQMLSASGGTGPYTYAVASGSLPSGISLSSSGMLTGTATIYGTSNFTVRSTDAYNCSATQSYTLLVKGLSLGGTAYNDNNYNGLHDSGEPGMSTITVELWNPGADNAIGGTGSNSDQLLTTTTSNSQGFYSFTNLQPGTYFMRVLMPTAQEIIGGNPVNLDDGVPNENKAALQPGGPGTPAYSPIVIMRAGQEPTVDDGDPDTNYTLDYGLFGGLSVGNLVWQDSNDNGQVDNGEPGIDGVAVQIWSTGADNSIGGTDDVLLKSTTTSGGGGYSFTSLTPGNFYVRIPTPPGAQPISSSVTAFVDNGVDNVDKGLQLDAGAVNSPVITLTPGTEPGSGGNYNPTIDFGLVNMTPTVYVSATQADSIEAFDSTSGLYTGSLDSAFGNSLSQGNGDYGDVPYDIELGMDGNWYVAHYGASNIRKISPTGVDLGPVLDNSTASVSMLSHFAFGPDGNFYVYDENGARIVRFQGPAGTTPGAPMGAAPYTFISVSGVEDINIGPDGNLYVVVQTSNLSLVQRYSLTTGQLLNVIVTDTQLVNLVPGGQSIALVSGIDIEGNTLYGVNRTDGEVFSVDISTPSAPGQPQLVATISSAGKGTVDTRDVEFDPSNNRLYIAGYHWGKPVIAGSYSSGSLLSVDITQAPNGTVSIYEVPIPRPPGPDFEIWSGPRDVTIGRPFAPLPNSVSIGSMVWNDANVNSVQDAGEQGIPGVRVELWQDANGNPADGAEFFLGWTYTDNNGYYYFSGEPAGVYQVQIPTSNFLAGLPLAGNGSSSPISSGVDDQTDGNNDGMQQGGPRTLVSSPLITLTPGTEPLGNGATGTEFAQAGELDDYTVDANGDMTVDFGFVEPGVMGIGNLVFVDDNGNQLFDLGEGCDGVTVQLYRQGDTPGSTQPLATAVTANGGRYLFSSLYQGQYFVYLPAAQFESSGNLRGLFSIPVITPGDDNVGQDALPTTTPWSTGISSRVITLVNNHAPTDEDIETGFDYTSDDADDANTDLTIDIGLFRPVAMGNMVFEDINSNGHYDTGEGLSGVTVQLYTDTQFPEVDTPIAVTTSDAVGRYAFNFLLSGNYVMHIPASQFQSGGPLYQRIPILQGIEGDDDVGQNGINNGSAPINGVSTLVISIYPGNAPTDDTGETGFEYTSDDEDDASIDLTIDFGFQSPVGVGNLVYIDTNQNGVADAGEGVDGVTVELYSSDQTPGVGLPLFSRITSNGGAYFFDSLPAGSYIVHIPSSAFQPGNPLSGLSSMNGVDPIGTVLDDNVANNDNGIDDPTPFLNGISSAPFPLTVGGEPTISTGQTGMYNTMDSFNDANFDLTIDFGFAPSNPNGVAVGNVVFTDLNGNGICDQGEGVDGVKVQLFPAAATPLTAPPLASLITSNGGAFMFSNLTPGNYQLFIPPSEFAAGKPLFGWRSLPGNGGDDSLDDDVDENGVDSDNPSVTGIGTLPFNLQSGLEPTDSSGEDGYDTFMDDANDANGDLTIDFGFYQFVGVGNLVFIDANYNGRADPGEGVSGVALELYQAGAVIPFDAPVATTTTASDGSYLFTDLTPGSYFVRVPPSQFSFGAPLYNYASVLGTQLGDDNLGEKGLDDGNPNVNGIQCAVVNLSPTNAPTGSQEGGYMGSSDDLNDAAINLTIDFGFVKRIGVGNVVFQDTNNDGIFDPSVEYAVDGVTVELWNSQPGTADVLVGTTTTYGGGLYSFNIAPGSYYVRIPPVNFQDGGVLANLVPSKSANPGYTIPTSTSGDDDHEQDGYTATSVVLDGARSPLFTLSPGQEPTAATNETGYYCESDDYDDANVDLTVDFGFTAKPLSVGNLVFYDVNGNGHFDSADFGVAGVTVQLFPVGANPNTATPVMQMNTGADGSFLLSTYTAGQFYLHIPASMFATGKPLYGMTSVPGFGGDDAKDDDVDENGIDAANPASTGLSSSAFALAYGTEPLATTGETGFLGSEDAYNDADVNLTIDLGFIGGTLPTLMNIGNLVFNDANNNGVADAGEGVPGVLMRLYMGTSVPGSNNYIRSTVTDANGAYLFSNLNPGVYIVQVAADNFQASVSINGGAVGPGPLYLMISLRGNQTTITGTNLGDDGIDAQNPEQVGISAPPVTLSSSGNLVIDFGFAKRLGVGNLVFRDANADGIYQPGIDTGIVGINLQLIYNDGIGGADTVIGTTTTDSNGEFILFAPPAISPQSYKVFIPAAQFSSSGPLNFMVPSALNTTGTDDNYNQNALPATNPAVTGVYTASFPLVAGTLPTDADGRESGFDKTSDNYDDADNDLTIDLGLKAKSLMVGNVVFSDVNASGAYEAGIDLPVANVTVQLFQQAQAVTDAPVSTAVTAADGTFMLWTTTPDAYYVHIPASMFAYGAPLVGLFSVPGSGNLISTNYADTGKDDRYDENGIDVITPASTGISSGIFNLAFGSMPLDSSLTATSGENGLDAFMDDVADDAGIMTIDFGFVSSTGSPLAQVETRNLALDPVTVSSPATFTAWQAQNSLNGLNGPNDDPEADGQTNLLEYALGTTGNNGLGASHFTLVNNSVTGAIDALVTRPAGAHADLRFYLEGSSDLAIWNTIAINPATTNNADQTQTQRYSQVDAAFSGASRGFLRLKVTLDANLDGTPEASTTTGALGWARMQFAAGRQSLSMPLLLPAIYTGKVSSISGSTVVVNTNGADIHAQLLNGVNYYVEVLDGTLKGRTFDLNASATSGGNIMITTSADSSLVGTSIRIRPHWTLGALLPVGALQPAATEDAADRVMFFDSASGQFQIDWLHTTAGAAQWVRDGDASLANDSSRIIPPQAGMLVQLRSTPTTLTLLGEVRTVTLALPQTSGTSLSSTGLATPQTPGALPFTPGSRLRLWSGDADPTTATYQNYLLNPQSDWVDESTGLDVTQQPLLDAFRAFFLVQP